MAPYPLPESQLDRFLLRLRIGLSGSGQREGDPSETGTALRARPPAVLTGEEVLELQALVDRVVVDDSLVD